MDEFITDVKTIKEFLEPLKVEEVININSLILSIICSVLFTTNVCYIFRLL